MDPIVPPSAEKTTIKPDMAACWCLGNDDKMVEFNVGYMGAKNKPMSGKR